MKAPEYAEPRFVRRDVVEVREPGIAPYAGTVTAVKWSSVSGWWIEVELADGTGRRHMTQDQAELTKRVAA